MTRGPASAACWDLFLALDRRFPDAKYAYLLELKHVRAGATEREITAAQQEGEAQLRRYLADPGLLPVLLGERTILSAVLVFVGAREHRIFTVR